MPRPAPKSNSSEQPTRASQKRAATRSIVPTHQLSTHEVSSGTMMLWEDDRGQTADGVGQNVPGATTVAGDDAQQYTYRALMRHPSRMEVNPVVYSTDREFIGWRRQLAWNTALDLEQNFALIGWMIGVHQTYVSSFEFRPRTKDPVYNRELKEWYDDRVEAEKLDVQQRLSLDEMMATFVALKILQGYSFMLEVEGGRLQLFEAWNLARGEGYEKDEARLGVKISESGLVMDPTGNAIEWFAIATGDTSATLVHRMLAHKSQVIIGGFTSRTQGRLWESPLLPAMNFCRDYLSAHEYYLMKMKIAAMFGFFWARDSLKKGGFDFPMRDGMSGSSTGTASDGADTSAAPPPPPLTELRPGMILFPEKDDKVGFLESKTPPAEFINMGKVTIRMILSSLYIPLSFYDSETANYSSMRGDGRRYQAMSRRERNKNRSAMRRAIKHIMRGGLADGTMPVWKNSIEDAITRKKLDMPEDVDRLPFGLIPTGVFLLDAAKELPAIIGKVSAGWQSNEDACVELGTGDFYDNIDRISDEERYAAFKKVTMNRGQIKYVLRTQVDEDDVTGHAGEAATPEGTPHEAAEDEE